MSKGQFISQKKRESQVNELVVAIAFAAVSEQPVAGWTHDVQTDTVI